MKTNKTKGMNVKNSNSHTVENKSVKNKKNFKKSKKDKLFVITEEQLIDLYYVLTSSNPSYEKLTKVKNNGDYWFEHDCAVEEYHYTDDPNFKKEYENLKNGCKKNEFVILENINFTLQQMIESVDSFTQKYIQENEDAYVGGLDLELANLILLSDILKQSIS